MTELMSCDVSLKSARKERGGRERERERGGSGEGGSEPVLLSEWPAGNTALVSKTVLADIHVVGKRLHTLPSHPALGKPQGFS